MCLYTKMVRNPKYLPNKKNKGNPPECTDERVRYIPVSCGNCIECRKKKQREWRVRMQEEIKHDKTGKFITLTFSEEALKKAEKQAGTTEANAVATKAIRMFLERWRKKYKKSVKHWLITELGHNNTERLHLHGIIFTDKTKEEIKERWGNGEIYVGYEMGSKCINYVMKYILKVDKDHPGFIGKILVSKGIGKGYIGSYNASKNTTKNETYILNNGCRIGLPQYYRNKIYTEKEKEQMWIEKIEKEELYVLGHKIRNINTTGKQELSRAINYARIQSKKLGYGGGEEKKQYMTKKGKIYFEKSKKDITFEKFFEKAEKRKQQIIKHLKNNSK